MKQFNVIILMLLSVWFIRCHTVKQAGNIDKEKATTYSYKTPGREGTGKVYMGREIAKIEMASLELTPGYGKNKIEYADIIIKKLHLLPTDVVADIGAGTGFYTFKITGKVQMGKVYAVEIQDELIKYLRETSKSYTNIEIIKGTEQSPNLPENSIDVALLIKTYHELTYPHEMLQSIKKALKADGKLILIERSIEGLTGVFLHGMRAKEIKKELGANGFKLTNRRNFLPTEHFMAFTKMN